MRAVSVRTLLAVKRILVCAGAIVVLAGCGGSKTIPLYSQRLTEPCLRKHPGVDISRRVDFVASTADAAFRVHLPFNDATLSFTSSADAANNIANAYRRFHSKNVGVEDVLRVSKNVVVLWRLHPKSDDEIVISNCLK